MPVILSLLLAAVSPILTADRAKHTVTFSACATDVNKGTTLEFAFIGPTSDRAYEAMFVTDASITEIAKAFDDAGIPRGRAVGQSTCRFWPAGPCVTLKPSVFDFISDENRPKKDADIFYTGGVRDSTGTPAANAEMPSALFSLYRLDQSLLLYGDVCDQSAVYGRFTANGQATSGKRYVFTVSWDGNAASEARVLKIAPGRIREAIASLKGASRELDVTPSFSGELTLTEAKAAAQALSVVDSQAIKINGFAEGQFFYRGFLPDEKWRDRTKRLTQPLEVRLDATNVVCTVIDEDWSVEGPDPKLTPHEMNVQAASHRFKGDACLFFARADARVGEIFALVRKLPKQIKNWYVFID